MQPTQTAPLPLASGIAPAETSERPKEQSVGKVTWLTCVALLGDCLVIFAAFSLAYWLRWHTPIAQYGVAQEAGTTVYSYIPHMIIGGISLLYMIYHSQVYTVPVLLSRSLVVRRIIKSTFIWFIGFLAISLMLRFTPELSRLFAITAFCCVNVGLIAWRLGLHFVLQTSNLLNTIRRRLLIVGWSDSMAALSTSILERKDVPYDHVGYLAAPRECPNSNLADTTARRLGTFDDLSLIAETHGVSVIVASEDLLHREELVQLGHFCELKHIDLKIVPSGFSVLRSGLKVEEIGSTQLLGVSQLPLHSTTNALIKRIVDIIGGFTGLFLAFPMMFLFALLIYKEDGFPIFFKQLRYGRNGKAFWIYKLRSMRMNAEAAGGSWTIKGDPRCLKIGALMRRWNVDELPQFWNVLKGDMSMVGPRPEVLAVIDERQSEVPHYHARHEVKPGLTGLAQVNGFRGDTCLKERIRYDLKYIESWNLLLDLEIIAQTMFRRDNAH
jgi:exopolysaccharide biosynthesis polyprenyl glycosylphosphotransferase